LHRAAAAAVEGLKRWLTRRACPFSACFVASLEDILLGHPVFFCSYPSSDQGEVLVGDWEFSKRPDEDRRSRTRWSRPPKVIESRKENQQTGRTEKILTSADCGVSSSPRAEEDPLRQGQRQGNHVEIRRRILRPVISRSHLPFRRS